MLKFLKGEILEEIKDMYSKDSPFLAGHRWEEHILPVIAEAQNICKILGEEYTIEIELGCALHDIGLRYHRNLHHEIGATMASAFISVYKLLGQFGGVDKDLVVNMVKHHRASNELIQYCDRQIQIVNMADRGFTSVDDDTLLDTIIRRSFIYATKSLELSLDDAVSHVVRHIDAKYGLAGYAYQNPLINEVLEKRNGDCLNLKVSIELLSGKIYQRIEKIYNELDEEE